MGVGNDDINKGGVADILPDAGGGGAEAVGEDAVADGKDGFGDRDQARIGPGLGKSRAEAKNRFD